jgi:hypothetical protein
MAKWDMEPPRYFISLFDGVPFVIPVKMGKQWIKWMCSNDTTLPEWATAVSGNLTFTDPRYG